MPSLELRTDGLSAAVDTLARGGIVVYPTETLYGLGADAASDAALRRLAGLKGRGAAKPFPVLVSSRSMLLEIVAALSGAAERLIEEFWPGALTLVLPARAHLSPLLTANRGTIGVRISSHPVARSLVERLGRPVTATSANPGGEPPAMEVAQARRYFGSAVDAYVDGGPTGGEPASTVVDLSAGPPRLLREGAIPVAMIERACGAKIPYLRE